MPVYCQLPTINCQPPEFWERYVRFLQSKGMKEEATGALQRATTVYCRTRPEIHVFAARFEEQVRRPQLAEDTKICDLEFLPWSCDLTLLYAKDWPYNHPASVFALEPV